MNISSAVVRVVPEALDDVKKTLEELDFCELHFNDDGRIIITLEANDLQEETKLLKEIEKINSVISTDIMYTYNEGEIDQAIKEIEDIDKVAAKINNENANANQIKYTGDLRNYDI